MEIIDLTLAKEMVARYETTRKDLVDETYGINDTRSVWFDIAGFKDFTNKLPAETTGVRIYLGVNSETEPVAPDQTTVIFIGTVNKGNGDVDAISSTSVAASGGLAPANKGKDCPPLC